MYNEIDSIRSQIPTENGERITHTEKGIVMDDQTMRSALRVFTLLELLAQKGAMGVTELGIATGLNKATVHRHLNTLLTMGYVKKDDKSEKYSLTFKLLEIAGQLLNHVDIRNAARPYLEILASQTGETVHLVQREGVHIVYIDKVEPTVNSVRMVSRIGIRQPLYCTAVGKALLAERTDHDIRSVWENSDIHALTPYTIVSLEDFMEEMHQIRQSGYAVDNEENELGVRCVAVSLRNYAGDACHAISVSAPASRMSDDKLNQIAEQLLQIKNAFPNKA